MATVEGVNTSPSSPRVKFRWCRTVPCQTREVYLILTSVTGAQVTLVWKSDLGWFESDLVSLPCGLHSGFLLIREKVTRSLLRPSSVQFEPNEITERDYKVDPFFVSPHKFSIELFLQSSRTAGIWQENILLRERYLSSHDLDSGKAERFAEEGRITPRKWASDQELRNAVTWNTKGPEIILGDDSGLRTFEKDSEDAQEKRSGTESLPGSKWPSKAGSSGIGLNVDIDYTVLSPTPGTKLKKWRSAGDRSHFSAREGISPDSSYHSRSRSLQVDTEVDSHDASYDSSPAAKPSGSDGDEVSPRLLNYYIKTKEYSDLPSVASISYADLNRLKLETIEQTRVIESILDPSDEESEQQEAEDKRISKTGLYFKEVNPPSTEGYGCLITFESRSTSIDDLGSPRALEDVLVSLTSSDTESKHLRSSSFSRETSGFTSDLRQKCKGRISPKENVVNTGIVGLESGSEVSAHSQTEVESEDRSGQSEREYNYHESDITIHEDENFQYDSLKHDDYKIPLNVKDILDSEESSEFSVLPRPDYYQTRAKIVISDESQIHRGFYNLEISNKRKEPSSGSCQERSGKKSIAGSYDVVQRAEPTSANGAVATEPFCPVHPGSLRSDNGNRTSVTLTESQQSSDTLKENLGRENTVAKPETCKNGKTVQKSPPSDSRTPSKSVKRTVSKKTKKSSSVGKTVLIIRDRRPPKMNSMGTQTSYREPSAPPWHSYSVASRTLPFASKCKENLRYSPLPDKVNGPWSSKYGNERYQVDHTYSDNTHIRTLQRNLYNLSKADHILRKIHPFDYRPTVVHKQSSSETTTPSQKEIFPPRHQSRLGQTTYTFEKSLVNPVSSSSSNSATIANYGNHSLVDKNTFFRSTALKGLDRTVLHPSYYSTTTLKRVPNPHLSVYGKYYSEGGSHWRNGYPGTTKHLSVSSSPHKSSILCPANASYLRPATSLPDLRKSREGTASLLPPRTRIQDPSSSVAFTSRPSYPKIYDYEHRRSASYTPRTSHSFRKSLDEGRSRTYTSSGESTDSLIDEAEDASSSYTRHRLKSEYFDKDNASPRRDTYKFRRRRTKSSSEFITQPIMSPTRMESSVSDVLRTRSETDLRMVGILAGGRQGEPPYLPYRREQLSVGQVVKVLVPGEGVAMARVVYAPARNGFSLRGGSERNQEVTVVLISEPTNLSGSVITIPLSKVLLAWPK